MTQDNSFSLPLSTNPKCPKMSINANENPNDPRCDAIMQGRAWGAVALGASSGWPVAWGGGTMRKWGLQGV
jgi:hypothetical protein